ncbi:MAG: ATP synthase F1 subunit epsilon [Flavobacteriales bacterium]|jgi:F-type H+-transporting ATPase subunit epsilon|nr:ATP synthase F1 subunit epsilon [Flavobacteriales bacterium]MDC3389659.1 ATP synthase F1 subunit epsilon [Flavobacteriales bacterium]MDG1239170.1 ATP synthase F1 subunit epsilon [Flavobacteriales bacterium]MDG1441018.1 ATP synthase F1 subunit epsilon [Flavobacteriales bacterium]MDG1798805.1 ATP synthase F1 subunit epsilon [Flavobacteriales bacterium]
MDVQIVTPDKSLYSGQADLITVPGTSGSIGILNNHAPLVSSLKMGEVKIVLNDKEEFFNIKGGVVEVSNNKVIVLAS